jgi:hypothetical protein
MVSAKIGIGAILVVLGIGGMAYAMPIESNSLVVDKNSPVIYNKEADSGLQSTMMPYIWMVIASSASFVLGIAFLSIGQTETLKPVQTTSGINELEEKKIHPVSFTHATDAA